MVNMVVAKKYAQALLEISGSQLEVCEQHLKSLEGVVDLFDLKDSKQVLLSPAMPNGLKSSLLNYALEKSQADQILFKFIDRILDSGRVKIIPEIVRTYENLVFDANGIKHAIVFSAQPMDIEGSARVRQDLESIFSCKVRLETRVSPELLGGFAVHVGNSLIDLSLKTKLEAITSTKSVRGT